MEVALHNLPGLSDNVDYWRREMGQHINVLAGQMKTKSNDIDRLIVQRNLEMTQVNKAQEATKADIQNIKNNIVLVGDVFII